MSCGFAQSGRKLSAVSDEPACLPRQLRVRQLSVNPCPEGERLLKLALISEVVSAMKVPLVTRIPVIISCLTFSETKGALRSARVACLAFRRLWPNMQKSGSKKQRRGEGLALLVVWQLVFVPPNVDERDNKSYKGIFYYGKRSPCYHVATPFLGCTIAFLVGWDILLQ